MSQQDATWWGDFRLPEGATKEWSIGPLRLAVGRELHEWDVRYEWVESPVGEVGLSVATAVEALPAYDQQERYVCRAGGDRLRLRPVLADRPVISRPVVPLHLLAGEEVTLFVSSPVWLRLAVGEPPRPLTEIAIQRPSDTWFGPSTMEGQLCYDSRSQGRLSLERVPRRPHRAVTRVVVRNAGEDAMRLERLSLPVPYLALFAGVDGRLWTRPVTLVRDRSGEMGTVRIHKRVPEEAGDGAELLSPPRERPDKGSLVRALSALFG
ncbi:MAG: hypothetical protein D6739_12950 [Nitrospirae bacterium]|nr:MAG: hypothetical protein D6739_12950 [Nitrospirota bacterium]